MRGRLVTLLVAFAAVGLVVAAAPSGQNDPAAPFLGEWSVKLHNTGTTFEACWLKVFRKEDGKLDMRMLWRWGSVTGVKSVKVADGELQWVRPEWWEEKQKSFDTTYRARIENGKLVGSVKMPWGEVQRFSGVPSIDRVDVEGTWICVADEDPDQIERKLILKQDGNKVSGTYDDGELKGKVVGATLEGNKFSFKIEAGDLSASCQAKIKGDYMSGTWETETDFGTFSGRRKRQLGQKIVLFNGKDFTGWHSRDPKRKKPKWAIRDGYMYPLPGATDIVTDRKFDDFILHVEYRLPKKHGNSGVYVRGRYEVQIYDDYGKGVSKHGCCAIYSRVAPTKNVTKPYGTWQTLDITVVDHWITVVHNGVKVIDNAYLEGITGGALDPNENEPGPIMLQAHGEAVNFRNVVLTPLLK